MCFTGIVFFLTRIIVYKALVSSHLHEHLLSVLLASSHCKRHDVLFHCGVFVVVFLMIGNGETLFMMPIFMSSLEKTFLYILSGLFRVLPRNVRNFHFCKEIPTLIRCLARKCFLQFAVLSFYCIG